jgi:hypothetical protein
MSTFNQALNTGNQAINNYDVSKIFLWGNRYEKGEYTAGADITLVAGTVMSRIAATGKITTLNTAGADGSQFPVGILAQTISLLNGATSELNYCIAGDVAREKVVLVAGTLATVVSGKTVADRIISDTMGIKLVAGTEMTEFDNQ